MKLAFNILDAKAQIIAESFGYQPTVDGQPNPVTAQMFLEEILKSFLLGRLREKRRQDIEAQVMQESITLN